MTKLSFFFFLKKIDFTTLFIHWKLYVDNCYYFLVFFIQLLKLMFVFFLMLVLFTCRA